MNKMQKQAKTVSLILKDLAEFIKPGLSLLEVEAQAQELTHKYGAKSYNLGYKPHWATEPYPYYTCLSVNSTIAHGIPNGYRLQDGDLLNIDIGIVVDGLCGDAALTVPVGELSNRDERLLRFTRRAVYAGAEVIRDGVSVIEIGEAINRFALQMGYVVNQRFVGHKIFKEMHEKPDIPHFYMRNDQQKAYFEKQPKLKAGDVICLEPMLTYKDDVGRVLADGYTCVTRDGRKSAMFEHMIEVTATGYNILTDHFQKEQTYGTK